MLRAKLIDYGHAVVGFDVVCSRLCAEKLMQYASSFAVIEEYTLERVWKVLSLAARVEKPEAELDRVSDALGALEEALLTYDVTGDDEYCEHLGGKCSAIVEELRGVLSLAFVEPEGVDSLAWVLSLLQALHSFTVLAAAGDAKRALYILPAAVATRILVYFNRNMLRMSVLPALLCPAYSNNETMKIAAMMLRELRKRDPRTWSTVGPFCLMGVNCSVESAARGRCKAVEKLEVCPGGLSGAQILACLASLPYIEILEGREG